MKNYDDPAKTPEDIVSRIENLSNRPDIKEVQALQVKEIREWAAIQFEEEAARLEEQVSNYPSEISGMVSIVCNFMRGKASLIRQGRENE